MTPEPEINWKEKIEEKAIENFPVLKNMNDILKKDLFIAEETVKIYQQSNEALKAEVDLLSDSITAEHEENELLKAENERLIAENDKMLKVIEKLNTRVLYNDDWQKFPDAT